MGVRVAHAKLQVYVMVFLQTRCAYCAQKWCDSLWRRRVHNVGARVAHATLQENWYCYRCAVSTVRNSSVTHFGVEGVVHSVGARVVGARVAHATLQVCHGISTDALRLLCAKVV